MSAPVYRKDYESMAEALAVKGSAVNASLLERAHREGRGERWFGPETKGTAAGSLELFAKGWSNGAQRITKLAEGLSVPAPTSIRRRRVRGDQGDELDIHRVYSGNLDTAWQRPARMPRIASRVVTIVCPIAICSNTNSEQMFHRGAAVLCLADAMQEAGYNVAIVATITAISFADYGKADMVHSVQVKAPEQPLDMGNLAAILAHSGFFRSAGFCMIASYGKRISSNFGEGDTNGRLSRLVAADYIAQGDTVIVAPFTMLDARSSHDWLNKQLATLNPDKE